MLLVENHAASTTINFQAAVLILGENETSDGPMFRGVAADACLHLSADWVSSNQNDIS
jgi:hypothetical protein